MALDLVALCFDATALNWELAKIGSANVMAAIEEYLSSPQGHRAIARNAVDKGRGQSLARASAIHRAVYSNPYVLVEGKKRSTKRNVLSRR
jgi:hypothetical protein